MVIVSAALLVVAAAAGSAASVPGARSDGRPRHRLYVSTFVSSNSGATYAYEIRNGLAVPTPVLKYGGGSGINFITGPLGSGPDDQLLTGDDHGFDSNYATFGIQAFAKDSTTQARVFFPLRGGLCEYLIVTAVASLPHQAMFVGYGCYFSGAGDFDGRHRAIGAGVLIYAVDSPTKEHLARILLFRDGVDGLAVDADGSLYVASKDIAVIATPLTHPRYVRKIRGTSFSARSAYPAGITIDDHGELYVVDEPAGTISAYPDGARGMVAPDRTITTTAGSLMGSIAVYGHTLFTDATTSSGAGVEAFDSRTSGMQSPIQFLSVPNIFAGVAVSR